MRTILIIAALAAPLGGCAVWREAAQPTTSAGQTQAWDASRQAAMRCPGGGAEQRGGTNGTSPADYSCERPKP